VSLLTAGGDIVVAQSSFWTSKAWPPHRDSPDYLNAVCQVEPSDNNPSALLKRLNAIETTLGRTRDPSNQWANRTVDLDLLDYNGFVESYGSFLTLPHPRLADRDFVLEPLLEICPDWRHPITNQYGFHRLAALKAAGRTNDCRKTTASH
jgi:2-amino-4-hydroxy-6-hydroxymethyldihydropteridine diphosphokinase